MFVYIVGTDDKCKVGVTSDPVGRLKQIESHGGKVNHVLLSTGAGDGYAWMWESALHRILDKHRIRGNFMGVSEWVDMPFDEVVDAWLGAKRSLAALDEEISRYPKGALQGSDGRGTKLYHDFRRKRDAILGIGA